MHIFYAPEILSSPALSEDESKHAIRVLRCKEGDQIAVVDGKGTFCTTKILIANPKRCELQLIKTNLNFEKRNFHLHLAVAPTKNINRFEWLLEKATEIGVEEITPIICENSERKSLKHERLNRVLVAAIKQSQKAFLPKLNPLCSFSDFVKHTCSNNRYIAHQCQSAKPLLDVHQSQSNATILIGPEGDFTSDELDLAMNHNFLNILLGTSRLRTETAGVVACSLLSN